MSIEFELVGGPAVVTINRAQIRNAIAPDATDELGKAIDDGVGARPLVITGVHDKAFGSGGHPEGLATPRTRGQAAGTTNRTRRVSGRPAGFPRPVIAAFSGRPPGYGGPSPNPARVMALC